MALPSDRIAKLKVLTTSQEEGRDSAYARAIGMAWSEGEISDEEHALLKGALPDLLAERDELLSALRR